MYNIFPTSYFPSIGYMALFLNTETARIELYETYRKQSCRTRCRVMTANGLQTLSIPVVKTNGNHTLIKDIGISYAEPWQQIHQRCLQSAYKKSPYFDHYFPFIEAIFKKHFSSLIEINEAALISILNILKIKKDILYTKEYEKITDPNDYRLSLSKQETDDFAGSMKSQDVNEPDKSKDKSDITINSAAFPHYYQVFEDRQAFTPNLSILDLIFNEGPESIDYLERIKDLFSKPE